MATQNDVRRIAMALPGVSEDAGRFAFSVDGGPKRKAKGIAWVWLERVDPKKARVPNPSVIAVRVRDNEEKLALLAGAPDALFTEPHYNGFPAVLVRLRAIRVPALRALLNEAWRCQAPKALVAEHDGAPAPKPRRPNRAR